MNWDSFYDCFYGWSEAGQRKIALMQKDFGNEEEVAEIGMAFFDEVIASKFINRALTFGVKFSAESLVELADFVDESTLERALSETDAVFTQEQLETLDCYVSEETMEALGVIEDNDEYSCSPRTKGQKRRAVKNRQNNTLTGSKLFDAILGLEIADWLLGGGKHKK